MDGSGHQHPPVEWHPGPIYDYDPYTNTLLPMTHYGLGFAVEYRWPAANQRGPPYYSSSSSLHPLGHGPPRAAAQWGRGRARGWGRGRGRGGRSASPRQHGGRGLLGSDPSSLQRPPRLPPQRRRRATIDEPSFSQPPAPVPLPPAEDKDDQTPPPPAASPSPPSSSHAAAPPVSNPVKNFPVDVDVSMTADDDADSKNDDDADSKKDDDAQGGSSKKSATDKKRLLPLDPPAPIKGLDGSKKSATPKKRLPPLDPPATKNVLGSSSQSSATAKKRFLSLDPPAMKNSTSVDVSMAHSRGGDDQGDVLGLNEFMAKKRSLLSISKKATSSTADAGAEEEAKAATDSARKKSRLGWGQGLKKYETNHWYKKDDGDRTTQKLVAHDGATGDGEIEVASSHGSSTPPVFVGSKGDGDNKSLDNDNAETRVSHVTTVPALSSKGSSRGQLTAVGDLGDPQKNGGTISLTEKAVSPAQEPARLSPKHRASPDGSKGHDDNNRLNDMDEMKVSHVTSRPLTGHLSDQNGSIIEKNVSPAQVPAHKHSISPDGSKGRGDNNSLDNDKTEMMVSNVTPALASSLSKGSSSRCRLKGAGDVSGPDGKTRSISRLTKKAVSLAQVPARFSRIHSSSPDGGFHDGGSIFPKVPAVPRRGSPPPDESTMELTKVQEIPPRMEKVIVQMVQRPRKILTKNVFSDEEPKTYERQGSKPKEWSQEEMDVFSEKITTFGMNFCKVSSFLRHKTTADCMQYYFERYQSECPKEGQKCLELNLPDKAHGESSKDEHEHVTRNVLVGESNSAPSPVGIISSQAACSGAPMLEKFTEDSCSNEAVHITKSSNEENVPQHVLIENHGDEGNCVAVGSCGHDTLKIMSAVGSCGHDTLKTMSLPDESCAEVTNGTIKGDQVRSGDKTPELCSPLKLANSNIDDGREAPSDEKTPNCQVNLCITPDPAPLTGPEFVQHMMKFDEAMEKKESEENDDKVKAKEGNNLVLSVASEHCSGVQLSCQVNSQKGMENLVDSIPNPQGNDLNVDMENPAKDNSPCVATNASPVRDDGLIKRQGASDAMYGNSENTDDGVRSEKENPVQSVVSEECNGIRLRFSASKKGKGIMPNPEVNDLIDAPCMQISNEAPRTYHLPSSSGCAALDQVDANSSFVAMDIDLNIPLDGTLPDVNFVDLENTIAEAAYMSAGSDSEATDSDATIVEIRPASQTTTTTATQIAQQQPANQPGSIMLFGRVIHQASSSSRTANHTQPNQGMDLQTDFVYSSNVLSNPVFFVTRRSGHDQVYPSRSNTAATNMWRSHNVPYTNRTALQLLPAGSSNSLVNMVNQQRHQALVNISPYSIMRGIVPAIVPSHAHQMPGSSRGAGIINFGISSAAQRQQWPFPLVDTSTIVFGHHFYYPGANAIGGATNNISFTGANNGEASISNTRAPQGGRGRR